MRARDKSIRFIVRYNSRSRKSSTNDDFNADTETDSLRFVVAWQQRTLDSYSL